MCLLVVASRIDPDAPLVVAANRDERVDRPATSATVLRAHGPRILGGRDDEAGGTWLAVNEHGLVAGLTNRPSQQGRDPSKRSRGELPLALAAHGDAREAAADFVHRFRPEDYNPSWLLVGDRQSLLYLDMTGDDRADVRELPPGIHVLENNPIDVGSAKQRHVMALVTSAGDSALGDAALARLLGDHTVPADHDPLPESVGEGVLAACVHTEGYGTRSSAIIRVGGDAGRVPEVSVADGHPCTTPFADVGGLWTSS